MTELEDFDPGTQKAKKYIYIAANGRKMNRWEARERWMWVTAAFMYVLHKLVFGQYPMNCRKTSVIFIAYAIWIFLEDIHVWLTASVVSGAIVTIS